MKLWVWGGRPRPPEGRQELEVEELWPHKQFLVLKFCGMDSISDAEALIGCELQVPAEQRATLEAGWSYISDLTGCLVFDAGREIGRVVDVQLGAGEAPLLQVEQAGRRFEIPFAEAYLKKLDVAGKRIEMQLPEGMLELDAPLSEEEKRTQAKSRP
jgi:16S rRNA processing protein RimM